MIAGIISVKSGDPLGRIIRRFRASLEDRRSLEIIEYKETFLLSLLNISKSSGLGVLYTQDIIIKGYKASNESDVKMKLPSQYRAAVAISELRNVISGSF
jgi:hypothetical protein